MILFDTDAIIIRYWGTSKEREFINSIISKNRDKINGIGITTYTRGEIYRTMLDALVCAFNVFLNKAEDYEISSLSRNEILKIMEDIRRSLLPGKRERRKERIKDFINDMIFKCIENDLFDINNQISNRNPLITIIRQLYNYITNFDGIFLNFNVFKLKKSKIDCQWALFKINDITLDVNTPIEIVGYGCSRFKCNEKRVILNWSKNQSKIIEKFILFHKTRNKIKKPNWFTSLISIWEKLNKSPPDLKNIYGLCRNIGDFFLILDANKDDLILSSNTRDFEDPCNYFSIEFIKIEREILYW